ncbi:MAG: hypothetical protein ACXVY5_00770 [Gaiellales bacterium]
MPVVQPAKVYRLGDFSPAGSGIVTGRPVTLSFTIVQPSGTPLTRFRTGPGPHTGVHLIIVRNDLSVIIHRHPPVAAGGLIRQDVIFPRPGPYRVLVDVYPRSQGAAYVNFQLFRSLRVSGAYHPQPLPAFRRTARVGGYIFTVTHLPRLRLAQAAVITVTVRDRAGRLVHFIPWYGALAHAIFFHARDLAYFHTHVCAPGAAGCTNVGGVSGRSSTPGVLHVGVLLPQAGTWRLFLQCRVGGRILTAPLTLKVKR